MEIWESNGKPTRVTKSRFVSAVHGRIDNCFSDNGSFLDHVIEVAAAGKKRKRWLVFGVAETAELKKLAEKLLAAGDEPIKLVELLVGGIRGMFSIPISVILVDANPPFTSFPAESKLIAIEIG